MLTEQEKKWLKERKHRLHWSGVYSNPCLSGAWKMFLAPDYKDAAEFEARVAVEAINLSSADVPCAHGMQSFWKTSCPLRNTKIYKDGKLVDFQGEGCGEWCLLRMARLEVEQEKEAEACKN